MGSGRSRQQLRSNLLLDAGHQAFAESTKSARLRARTFAPFRFQRWHCVWTRALPQLALLSIARFILTGMRGGGMEVAGPASAQAVGEGEVI